MVVSSDGSAAAMPEHEALAAAIARRYARLPREQAVRLAVARALRDPVGEVRQAAAAARHELEQALDT